MIVSSGAVLFMVLRRAAHTRTCDNTPSAHSAHGWTAHRSTERGYAGDTGLIGVKSSHRRSGLAPRCRLIASWGCRSSQGLGCSPIKAVRELGSERRETVRSLSVVGVGDLRGPALSTRGPGWTNLL